MRSRLLLVLLFGLAIAAASSFILYRLIMLHPGSMPVAAAVTHPVCIATRDLDPGTVIGEKDFVVAQWTGDLPAGALTKKEDVLGRAVYAPVYAKEPLMSNRLAAAGVVGGLAAIIPPGMRAAAVKVNEVVGVAGFVVPGSHVDVIASGGAGTGARTILQDLTVLSAGQDYKQQSDGKPLLVQVVNLLVTPQQAEILTLAGNGTAIQLVLRNATDSEKVVTHGVALAGLFGDMGQPDLPRPAPPRAPAIAPPPAPAPPTVKPPNTVEIIRGTQRTEIVSGGGSQ